MNHEPQDNLTPLEAERLLGRLDAGDLDSLTPGEVARLEAYLNDAAFGAVDAARLADATMAPAPTDELAACELPTAAEWDAIWSGIEERAELGADEHAGRTDLKIARWLIRHYGRVAAAAAACLVLMIGWAITKRPNTDDNKPWPLQLATDAEVIEVDASDDVTVFVEFAPDDNDAGPIIWFFEDKEGV